MLYYTDKGQGRIVVLLSGLLASSRYWDNIVKKLVISNRVITIDQLGFGLSPKPDLETNYTVKDNVDSYIKTLDELDVKEIDVLVGYSSSSILATYLTANSSVRVKNLILITPPIHFDRKSAIKALKNTFKTYKYCMFGPIKPFFIGFVTIFRPIIRLTSPIFLRHVGAKSARDAFSFTWKSLYSSIQNIIVDQSIEPDFQEILRRNIPVKIIYAINDSIVEENNLFLLKNMYSNIELEKINSSHQIPLESEESVVNAINSLMMN